MEALSGESFEHISEKYIVMKRKKGKRLSANIKHGIVNINP